MILGRINLPMRRYPETETAPATARTFPNKASFEADSLALGAKATSAPPTIAIAIPNHARALSRSPMNRYAIAIHTGPEVTRSTLDATFVRSMEAIHVTK